MRALSALILILASACTNGRPSPPPLLPSSPAQTVAVSGSIQPAEVSVEFNRAGPTTGSISGNAGVPGRLVTTDDPVRVASISKLAVSIAVMRLVDQKRIDLDRDVGSYLGFPVRNPSFADKPISLRLLLSHRSSLTDGGEYILPLDADLAVALNNPKAWDAGHAPGSYFRYTNFNSPVIAAVMEAATGTRFDRLMAELVFKPLKLDACFNWQTGCSANRRSQAVTLLRPNGDLAKDPAVIEACFFAPASDGSCDINRYKLGHNGSAFGPQGGMRISANGLVTIGRVLLDGGKPLISAARYAEMVGPVWRFDGSNGDDENGYFTAYGLGIHHLKDGNDGRWIGHVGEAYSLRAGLWVNRAAGIGRARYVTMVREDAPVGHCLDVCP